MRILAVLCVRDEGAFLLEWLAHHRCCGFTDVLVFSNDCSDGTDLILDRLAQMGLVTHVRNDGPYHASGIQFTALKAGDRLDVVKQADWILPFDVDEFVNIHVGDRTVPALLAALPDADAITLTWRLFGNDDKAIWKDAPVRKTFTKAAPEVMHWPWRHAMFKTLYRNTGAYKKLGVHRPRSPVPERAAQTKWYDAQGRALPELFQTKRIFNNYGRPMYGLAQLNHYALGTMEQYVMKAARGRAVHNDNMLDLDYWVERNWSIETDTTILSLPGVDDALSDLMADPQLAELHAGAVAWRKSRFTELMKLEPYRALYGRLLQTPPSRPVTRAAARMLTQHANAARSVD